MIATHAGVSAARWERKKRGIGRPAGVKRHKLCMCLRRRDDRSGCFLDGPSDIYKRELASRK